MQDEWMIRWADGPIDRKRGHFSLDDLLGSLPESPHARRRALNAICVNHGQSNKIQRKTNTVRTPRRLSFMMLPTTLFFGRMSS